ncbi:hypothetical protein BH11BAC2_BH11BAC2_26100 [soil metagenome]
MNEELHKYLEEGLAESYVLGLLNAEEIAIANRLMLQYPEFRDEVNAIREALTGLDLAQSTPPPAHLKSKIKARIFEDAQQPIKEDEKREATIRELKAPVKSPFQRYLVAASIITLFISLAYNIYLFSQLKTLRASLEEVRKSKDDYANTLEVQTASYTSITQTLAAISKPEIKKILLAGNDKLPGINTTVFWDSLSHAVYINTEAIPTLPSGKQYQLWALKDGKPIDAGVFDGNLSNATLIRVKDIDGAQAFAVTIEPTGGLPSPTMETLCLIGQVL